MMDQKYQVTEQQQAVPRGGRAFSDIHLGRFHNDRFAPQTRRFVGSDSYIAPQACPSARAVVRASEAEAHNEEERSRALASECDTSSCTLFLTSPKDVMFASLAASACALSRQCARLRSRLVAVTATRVPFPQCVRLRRCVGRLGQRWR